MELDSNDKLLLQKANTKLAEANAVLQFLAEYFREKYTLEDGSKITPTGEILNVPETLFNHIGVTVTENG